MRARISLRRFHPLKLPSIFMDWSIGTSRAQLDSPRPPPFANPEQYETARPGPVPDPARRLYGGRLLL